MHLWSPPKRGFFHATDVHHFTNPLQYRPDQPGRLCVGLQAVDKFLQVKGKLDGNAAPPLNDVMEALHSLTTVRANLAAGLSSGELCLSNPHLAPHLLLHLIL